MIELNMGGAKAFFEAATVAAGSYMGKAVAVIQANPAAVVAAVILVAALIIGVVCYKAYKANQENSLNNPKAFKKVEIEVEEVKKPLKSAAANDIMKQFGLSK